MSAKDYDIDEAKAREVRDLLEKRKANITVQSSAYLSGKLLSILKNKNLNSIVGKDLGSKSETEMKADFATVLNNGLHGLCFSPYLEGQNEQDKVTAEQISRRLNIIAPHTQWIRTFSCTNGNELIPELAQKKSLKTIVGAWISNDLDKNEKEIQSLINLAKHGLVNIAAVGNEVLHRNEITEKQLT